MQKDDEVHLFVKIREIHRIGKKVHTYIKEEKKKENVCVCVCVYICVKFEKNNKQ